MRLLEKVLWVIAARAGSKGIPDKNIKPLCGIPLLAYRIRSALKIAHREDVIISTDSKKYARIAADYGVTVPFIRPSELSTDTAASADVIWHAMQWAESSGRRYDAVGLLEPTSPFLYANRLFEAVKRLFKNDEAENIVAVRKVSPSTFYIQKESEYLDVISRRIAREGFLRRQDERSEVTPSGGFYIAKWSSFKSNKSFYTDKTLSFLVSDIEGLEIDEPLDWEFAEFIVENHLENLSDGEF